MMMRRQSLAQTWCSRPILGGRFGYFFFSCSGEGANREKLTVKKLIDNEMFFFHRLCPLQTVKNRRKP